MFSELCARIVCTNQPNRNDPSADLDELVPFEKHQIPSYIEFETVTLDTTGSVTYEDENYLIDPSSIQLPRKSMPRPKLKDMVHNVMTQRDNFIEDGRLPTVNKMMKIWEQAMQKRDKFIEENTETGGGADATETNDNEDIVELSTLFDYSEYSNALHSSDLLEEQVVDELATRIEEKFMLILANQESVEDLEKSCKIIHNILTKNPTSGIRNKKMFKNITKKLFLEVHAQKENEHNTPNTSGKYTSFVWNKVMVE